MALDLIRILLPFRPHPPSVEGRRDLPGVTMPPLPRPQRLSPSPRGQAPTRTPAPTSTLGHRQMGFRESLPRGGGLPRNPTTSLAGLGPCALALTLTLGMRSYFADRPA